MREKLTWAHTENVLGHTYHLQVGSETWEVASNLEKDALSKNRSLRKCFWFRAPKISLSRLSTTLEFLDSFDGAFCLEAWVNRPTEAEVTRNSRAEPWFDASLKVGDETDAATLAWSLTEIWMKWSKAQEQEFKQDLKPKKALKVTVDKDGNVRVKGKITTSSLSA